jgi:FkbM family methyltransferase
MNKNIIKNIIKIYDQNLLPIDHIKYLFKLKNEYNFIPKVCYDIGACALHWTREAKKVWPESIIYLFEANEDMEILYNNNDYYIGLLSDKDDQELKYYYNNYNFGGNSYYKEIATGETVFSESNYKIIKSKKLDTIVKELNFLKPDLIKIDVQGAELDILKGATEVLKSTLVILIEIQLIEYNRNAPTLFETNNYLNSIGFYCIDEKFSINVADADFCYINTNIYKSLKE